MNNSEINKNFLCSIDPKIKTEILENIAAHYCVSNECAYSEVTEDGAEHLLDYMTGPKRSAAGILMKCHG